MTRHLLISSVCAFLAASPVNAQQPHPTPFAPCPDLLTATTTLRDYRVRRVEIRTPFHFLRTVRNTLNGLTARLPQQAGRPFVDADVSSGVTLITDELGAGVYGIGAPFKLTAVTAVVDNCQSVGNVRELDVVYRVYSTEIPLSPVRTFESLDKDRRDPMHSAGVTRQSPRLRPRLAYDRSTKLRAGADVTFDHLTLGAEGLANSQLVNAATGSGWDIGRSWLQRFEWHAGYRYSNQPTEAGGLTRNQAVGHLSLLLGTLGSGPRLRTGVSVEGGHLESELATSMVPADNLVSTPYTAVKGYVGATLGRPRHSFVASYGVQLGATAGGFGSGFRKHVGDVAYRGRFLPHDHFPVEVALHLAAGTIENRGGLPVTERFFGGTVEQDFVLGNEWRIRANPVIRSFPQHRLARVGDGPPVGGENFVALSLTVAPTIWGRPLIPNELQEDKGIQRILAGQLNTAEMVLRTQHKSRDPAVSTATLSRVEDQLQALQVAFTEITNVFEAAATDVSVEDRDAFDICLDDTIIVAAEESGMVFDGDPAARYLGVTALIDGYLPDIRACVNQFSIVHARLERTLKDATRAATTIRERFLSRIDAGRAEAAAADELEYPRNVLDIVFRELNLASIAPVFMFDVARLGSQANQASGDLRLGVGMGVRCSLVSVAHLTVAYVFNPNPMPWEDRGAFVASLDVSDLFELT